VTLSGALAPRRRRVIVALLIGCSAASAPPERSNFPPRSTRSDGLRARTRQLRGQGRSRSTFKPHRRTCRGHLRRRPLHRHARPRRQLVDGQTAESPVSEWGKPNEHHNLAALLADLDSTAELLDSRSGVLIASSSPRSSSSRHPLQTLPRRTRSSSSTASRGVHPVYPWRRQIVLPLIQDYSTSPSSPADRHPLKDALSMENIRSPSPRSSRRYRD